MRWTILRFAWISSTTTGGTSPPPTTPGRRRRSYSCTSFPKWRSTLSQYLSESPHISVKAVCKWLVCGLGWDDFNPMLSFNIFKFKFLNLVILKFCEATWQSDSAPDFVDQKWEKIGVLCFFFPKWNYNIGVKNIFQPIPYNVRVRLRTIYLIQNPEILYSIQVRFYAEIQIIFGTVYLESFNVSSSDKKGKSPLLK